MPDIDSLTIEIGASSEDATSRINALTEALKELKSVTGGKWSNPIKDIANGVSKSSGGGSSMGKSAKEEASPLPDELQDAIRNANQIDVLTAKVEHYRDAMEAAMQAGDVDKAFSLRGQMIGAEEALAKAQEIAKAAEEARGPLERLKKSITDTFNAAKKAGLDAVANGIKQVGNAASKANTPLSRFLAGLKRIAMYRMLRTIIKAITDAFKEGLENAYTFSKGVAGEGKRFADAMDSMKVAGSTMKNQLGSAFIGLLAAIAPIVNAIISLVTALATALSQLFAVFTGGTYLKANASANDLADTMKAGGGAAKEWKNQLLGFDVINRLDEPSGGGGGGGAANDLSSLFDDTELDGFFKKLREKFLELKDSLNFEPLIESWNHLKEAVKGFLAVVDGALAWAWDNILVPLAHWTIEQVAPRMVELLAKAFELLTAVLEKLKPVFQWVWDNVLKPIAQFVGDAFLMFLDMVIDLIGKLTDLIKGNTTFKEFLDSLSVGQTILLALAAAFILVKGAIGLFNGAVTGIFLAVGAFNTAISALTSPVGLAIIAITALIAIGILLYKNWDTITAAMSAAWQRFLDACRAVGDFFAQWWQDVVNTLKAPWLALGEIYKSTWNTTISVLKAAWNGFTSLVKGAAENMAAPFESLLEKIKKIFNDIKTFISNTVNQIKSVFNFQWSLPHIKLPHFWVSGRFSLNPPSVPQFGINWYAQGGFPEDGLFMANHGELVGKFANGKTAVANNEQIQAGIAEAVYGAFMQAFTQTSGNNNNGNRREVVLNINGREFMRAVYDDQKAVAKEHGVSLVVA